MPPTSSSHESGPSAYLGKFWKVSRKSWRPLFPTWQCKVSVWWGTPPTREAGIPVGQGDGHRKMMNLLYCSGRIGVEGVLIFLVAFWHFLTSWKSEMKTSYLNISGLNKCLGCTGARGSFIWTSFLPLTIVPRENKQLIDQSVILAFTKTKKPCFQKETISIISKTK